MGRSPPPGLGGPAGAAFPQAAHLPLHAAVMLIADAGEGSTLAKLLPQDQEGNLASGLETWHGGTVYH